MIDLLIAIIIVGVGTSYIVQYLLLVRKNSHFGFFSSKDKVIVFSEKIINHDGYSEVIPRHEQPVTPLDYLRRIARAFRVDGNEWHVTNHADVWTCPFCLSFWIAFLGSYYIYQIYEVQSLIFMLFVHFAIAYIAQRLVSFDRQEGIAS